MDLWLGTIPESHKGKETKTGGYYVISRYSKYPIQVDKSKRRWLNQKNSF